MRTRRKIAAWRRKALERSDLDLTDEKVVAALAALQGKPAIYHCLSRIVNRERGLKREEKDMFVSLMRENFGPERKTGARRMRRVESSLHTMRDLPPLHHCLETSDQELERSSSN